MDLNNEAGLNTERSASAQSRHRAISHRGRAGARRRQPDGRAAAARSLAAWRRNRDQQPNTSNDQPQLRARAERAAPHEPAQESTPAQAGNDAGEPKLPPARPKVPIRQPSPARRRGRNCRPSSRRGLGPRKTRTSSRASLARRRSELPSASGHGRATSAAVSRRPPKRARPSRPNARRRNR